MTEKKIASENESIGKLAYEMGLNKWYIISNHAEEKKTRTNLKKLGCLFESFLGALFLDYNKLEIHDEDEWFKNIFVTGPGWQMAQKFVENVFETHVDWFHSLTMTTTTKTFYKLKYRRNLKLHHIILKSLMILKLVIIWEYIFVWDKQIYEVNYEDAQPYSDFGNFEKIQDCLKENDKVFVF